jgi:hypothetical protein
MVEPCDTCEMGGMREKLLLPGAPTEIEAPRVVGGDCENRLVRAADVSSENALVRAALALGASGEIAGRDRALASE